MDDLVGVRSVHWITHVIANVLRKSDKSSYDFGNVTWQFRVGSVEEYFFPEGETEDVGGVGRIPGHPFHPSVPSQGWSADAVQDGAYPNKAERPRFWGCTGTVHRAVCPFLNCLITPFWWILVLVVRFALPIRDMECPKNILHSGTDFYLCSVTYELGYCS